MSFDVFISYSSEDKAFADAACATLENTGTRCWIAPRDVLPGQPWDEAIVRAIDRCRAMVLIFTSNPNESPQVGREVKRAFNKGHPVIPVRVEDTLPAETLSYYLDSVHWFDAFTPPFEQHLKQRAEVTKAILAANGEQPLHESPATAPLPLQPALSVGEAEPTIAALDSVAAPKDSLPPTKKQKADAPVASQDQVATPVLFTQSERSGVEKLRPSTGLTFTYLC